VYFASPEAVQNTFGGQYDAIKSDLWSCGVMLYIMIFGRHPFMRPEVGEREVHRGDQEGSL
jgi:serine/threonine-protein kinase SRK2